MWLPNCNRQEFRHLEMLKISGLVQRSKCLMRHIQSADFIRSDDELLPPNGRDRRVLRNLKHRRDDLFLFKKMKTAFCSTNVTLGMSQRP